MNELDQKISDLSARISYLDAQISSFDERISRAATPEAAAALASDRARAEQLQATLVQQKAAAETERNSVVSTDVPTTEADHSEPRPTPFVGGLVSSSRRSRARGTCRPHPRDRAGRASSRRSVRHWSEATPLRGSCTRRCSACFRAEPEGEASLAQASAIAARVELAAEATALRKVALLAGGPPVDLGPLAERMQAAFPPVAPAPAQEAATRPAVVSDRGGSVAGVPPASSRLSLSGMSRGDLKIQPFSLEKGSKNNGSKAGLILVLPTAIKKTELAEVGHLLSVAHMPMLGVITYVRSPWTSRCSFSMGIWIRAPEEASAVSEASLVAAPLEYRRPSEAAQSRTRRVRVAQIVTTLTAGAGGITLRGALGLDPERFATTILAGESGRMAERAEQAGFEVVTVRALGPSRRVYPWADAPAYRELVSRLAAGRFDLVHTHSAKAGALGRLAARRAGVPVIVHSFHGFPFHEFQSPLVRRGLLTIERRLARFTDYFLTDGTVVASEAVRLKLAPPERIRAIASPIDAVPPVSEAAAMRRAGCARHPAVGTSRRDRGSPRSPEGAARHGRGDQCAEATGRVHGLDRGRESAR